MALLKAPNVRLGVRKILPLDREGSFLYLKCFTYEDRWISNSHLLHRERRVYVLLYARRRREGGCGF